jgi:hypothetical protein
MKIRTLRTIKYYNIGPGPDIIKIFTIVIYKFLSQVRVFLLCKPFQPSLMFACKAGAYLSVELFRYSTLGKDPGQTLDYDGKAFQGQTL